MPALEDVIEVQGKVLDLQQDGADMNSPEARRTMNRLMSLLRHLSPQELAQFDEWKRTERERRSTAQE